MEIDIWEGRSFGSSSTRIEVESVEAFQLFLKKKRFSRVYLCWADMGNYCPNLKTEIPIEKIDWDYLEKSAQGLYVGLWVSKA